MKQFKSSLVFAVVATFAAVSLADVMDRPQGFKIGQRMTLRPYVDISFVADSNQDQQPSGEDNFSWVINPGLTLNYNAENWSLDFGAFYRYTAFQKYINQLNEHSYGETLSYTWSNARASEKGWSLMLSESFQRVNEDDDMQKNNGRGLWRDRQTFDIQGAVERRFTDKIHASLNAGYYWLDYDNAGEHYGALYGWSRWMAGVELGYALSRWTDLLVSGSYQRYYQDNSYDLTHISRDFGTSNRYAEESQGYTLMIGVGSYATERISYRVLGGWSKFEYGDVASDDGFTYSVSGNWKISDTWSTMLMAQSAYQPSEREFGSANRVDSVSWGLGKSMIRGKLNATLDVAYRRETRSYSDASVYDYDEDIFSCRIGLNYTLNRFLAVFARAEYQACMFDGDMGGLDRDYDRFRGTIGFRLTY